MSVNGKNIQFIADRFSGFEGTVFHSSVLVEVIRMHNLRNRFAIPYMDANYTGAPPASEKKVFARARSVAMNAVPSYSSSRPDARKITLTKRERAMTELLKISEAIRDQRKRLNLIGSYTLSRFLDEIMRRRKLSQTVCERMFWFEFTDALYRTKEFKETVRHRHAASAIFVHGGIYYQNGIGIAEKKRSSYSKILRGIGASVGRAIGPARVILEKREFVKFKTGDVLIAENTRPDYFPIMHKASAIVTDEGGLTSHAAIVARELGIPCIVGTQHATRVFKDGDHVEVDAQKGIVRYIKKL